MSITYDLTNLSYGNRIYFDRDITDIHLRLFNNRYIRKAILEECDLVTDRGLSYLNNVEIIILCNNKNITGNGLRFLQHAQKITLKNFELGNNELIYLTCVPKIKLIDCKLSTSGLKYLSSSNVLSINIKHQTILDLTYIAHVPNVIINQSSCVNGLTCLTGTTHLTLVGTLSPIDELRRSSSLQKSIMLRHSNIRGRGIISYLSNHHDIVLFRCDGITHQSLQYLSHLAYARISFCTEIRNHRVIQHYGRDGKFTWKLLPKKILFM